MRSALIAASTASDGKVLRDQDKDGVKNIAEYREGTNPRQADTDNDGTSYGTDPDPCDHSGTGDQTPPTSPVTP